MRQDEFKLNKAIDNFEGLGKVVNIVE